MRTILVHISSCRYTSITLPVGITEIKTNTFYFCGALAEITIPENVQSIGSFAFSNCSNLTEVNLPKQMSKIEYYAFNNCNNLKKINIPDGVSKIEQSTFYDCYNLEEVSIPSSVKSIENRAFYNCEKLTSIYFNGTKDAWNKVKIGTENDSIESIEPHVKEFDYLSYDDRISISHWDSNATSAVIPEEVDGLPVTEISSDAFQDRSNLINIEIPNTVAQIGRGAFYYCSSLTNIVLPNAITKIEDATFAHCTNLKSVTIPNSVSCISYDAFNNCKSLTDVYYNGTEEEWNNISISSSGNDTLLNATIHYNASTPDISITGDLNGDNLVSVDDAVLTLTIYAKRAAGMDVDFSEAQVAAADINGDGIVDVKDAVAILTYYARVSAGLQPTGEEVIG